MTELENKIGVPGATVEPSKEQQSASLQESFNQHLNAGNEIKKIKPVNRRVKRAESGKSSKKVAKKVLKNTGVTMSCWAGYRVQVGTRISFAHKDWKPSKDVYAEVADLGSMQMKIFVKGKQIKVPKPYSVGNGLSFGLVTTEAYIRAYLCGDKKLKAKVDSGEHVNKSTGCLKVSVCQGWTALHLMHNKKTESVYARYKRCAG